jgi:LAO/AO transport system kinase
MQALIDWRRENGHWQKRREAQACYWFDQEVRQALLARLHTPEAQAAMADLSGQVATGALTPAAAAQQMLQQHLRG